MESKFSNVLRIYYIHYTLISTSFSLTVSHRNIVDLETILISSHFIRLVSRRSISKNNSLKLNVQELFTSICCKNQKFLSSTLRKCFVEHCVKKCPNMYFFLARIFPYLTMNTWEIQNRQRYVIRHISTA